MPIDYKKNQVLFREIVGVEEAEGLLEFLHKRPAAKIDFGGCTHLHPANLQVLMAAKIRIAVWPKDANMCFWLKSALQPEK
ncbi:MAG TPA: hypothetical protein HPP94_01240 [Desulfuromonadales bacterium]|nr:hypothetical protein [Desulfuromonadales bacterium]